MKTPIIYLKKEYYGKLSFSAFNKSNLSSVGICSGDYSETNRFQSEEDFNNYLEIELKKRL